MGEEIYYVRVATAHTAHACAGLPKQIPQNVHATPLTQHTNDQARAGGPNETTARRQTHDVSHTDAQVQCARVFVAESAIHAAISMWDCGIAGSHSLAPVHCDSCAITEHLSSVRSLQLG